MNHSQTIAQENLVLLQQHHPAIAKNLLAYLQSQREENRPSPFHLHFERDNQPILKKRVGGEETILVDEGYIKTNLPRIQSAMQQPGGLIFVFGSGLGSVWQAIAPRIPHKKIIFLEPELEVLFYLLQTRDNRAWLPLPHILLLSGPGAAARAVELIQTHPSLGKEGYAWIQGRRLSGEESAQKEEISSALQAYWASPPKSPPDLSIQPASLVFLAGKAHKESLPTLAEEAETLDWAARGAVRMPAVTRFVNNEAMLWETLGTPLPVKVITFSHEALRAEEWQRVKDNGIERILWCYDDPYRQQLDPSFFASFDRVYCFDPAHARRLAQDSPVPVAYLPAGTNYPLSLNIHPPEGLPDSLPVSFVGSTGLHRMSDRIVKAVAEKEGFFQSLEHFTLTYLQEGVPIPFEEVLQLVPRMPGHHRHEQLCLLEDLITFVHRVYYLSHAGDIPLTIFGDKGWGKALFVGPATRYYARRSLDYLIETPWIYSRSLINLNLFNVQCINSPTVRMLDAMACGGFLLTEDRPFIHEMFKVGEELEVFATPAEMRDKIEHYLHNPEKAREIGRRGRETIHKFHLYRHRLGVMLDDPLAE